MKLKQITVFIEYRMKVEYNVKPSWKVLRARVRSEDGTMGTDLVQPTSCSASVVINQCLQVLRHVETVVFTFDNSIGEENLVYQNGRLFEGTIW